MAKGTDVFETICQPDFDLLPAWYLDNLCGIYGRSGHLLEVGEDHKLVLQAEWEPSAGKRVEGNIVAIGCEMYH
jgi:hypothetical protein